MKMLPPYLEENNPIFENSISLSENINVLAENEAIEIANYMESCLVIDSWLSNIADVLTKEHSIQSKVWSDGEYFWNSSHIHYIKMYRARIPEDFRVHVKKRIEDRFDFESLDKENLITSFHHLLSKVAEGQQSVFDDSY
ncbi:hypothetical protein FLL45_08125 [Aliikangiella marina]|uniref:Uncharacterized protein n=1 Tax=Aliikangiella marina TaxID=1712262 RepID=A0A545TCH3_9GAMM|nr:hypothetical protein [Aliikangiella marina]TQV74917.1 hypothetical protein FLL45_08125 [Aliikangiella marina]